MRTPTTHYFPRIYWASGLDGNSPLDHHLLMAILQPLLTQQGWQVLPPVIIMANIRGIIDTSTTGHPMDLKIPTPKIHNIMETLSQFSVRCLTHMIMHKR